MPYSVSFQGVLGKSRFFNILLDYLRSQRNKIYQKIGNSIMASIRKTKLTTVILTSRMLRNRTRPNNIQMKNI